MKTTSFFRHSSLLVLFALPICGCVTAPQKLFGLSNEANVRSAAQITRNFEGPLWLLEGNQEDSMTATAEGSLLSASRAAGISSKWHKTIKVVYTPDATMVDAASALLPSGTYTFISRGTRIVTSTEEGDSAVITTKAMPLIWGVKELDVGGVYHVQRVNEQDGSQSISVTEAANP